MPEPYWEPEAVDTHAEDLPITRNYLVARIAHYPESQRLAGPNQSRTCNRATVAEPTNPESQLARQPGRSKLKFPFTHPLPLEVTPMSWLRRWCASALVFSLALTGHFARGQAANTTAKAAESTSQPKWQVDRTVTVSPRPESKPALSYRLFPTFTGKDGNAVPIYMRLNSSKTTRPAAIGPRPKKWLSLSVEEMPLAEAKAFLQTYKNFLRQFELAAGARTANWNYTLDQGNVIEMLLPDVQWMRGDVPMMVLKVRVELAEGNFAAAAHWLETGFAFSQHVGNGPFIINRLVGIASANKFADCLLDFVRNRKRRTCTGL